MNNETNFPFSRVALPDRAVLRLSGQDRIAFLQGLISNDVSRIEPGRAVYACLLSPQGKFLHDFFLVANGESVLIECEGTRRDDLLRRLKMYRLRSKVDLADETGSWAVFADPAGDAPDGAVAYPDPRRPALGIRILTPKEQAPAATGSFDVYDRLRIAQAVPDGSRDMEVGKAILLENNIDRLNGIAWDKGCYMGQELTARTRYRGLIKKRLVPVRIDGAPPAIGTPLIENGAEIGEMRSSNGDLGLALLRLEIVRRGGPIILPDLVLTPRVPDYLVEAFQDRASA